MSRVRACWVPVVWCPLPCRPAQGELSGPPVVSEPGDRALLTHVDSRGRRASARFGLGTVAPGGTYADDLNWTVGPCERNPGTPLGRCAPAPAVEPREPGTPVRERPDTGNPATDPGSPETGPADPPVPERDPGTEGVLPDPEDPPRRDGYSPGDREPEARAGAGGCSAGLATPYRDPVGGFGWMRVVLGFLTAFRFRKPLEERAMSRRRLLSIAWIFWAVACAGCGGGGTRSDLGLSPDAALDPDGVMFPEVGPSDPGRPDADGPKEDPGRHEDAPPDVVPGTDVTHPDAPGTDPSPADPGNPADSVQETRDDQEEVAPGDLPPGDPGPWTPDLEEPDPGPGNDLDVAEPPDPGPDADPGPDSCVPACAGRQCGPDGCGGICGLCPDHHACIDGTCVLQPWCGDGSCNGAENCLSCPTDCPCGPGGQCIQGYCQPAYPARRVGIFYLGWHAFATDAFLRVSVPFRRTIEDILRGQPGLTFGDMLLNHGLAAEAAWFHYQVLPADGAYCLYRRRPGEAPYPEPNYAPDCAGIAQTARRHARQIWESGIDFVFMDVTNVPFDSPFADVIGTRPVEVLAEEWYALRRQGIMTPQIAIWVPIPAKQPGQESWTYTVDRLLASVYNDPRYEDLVLRDPASGRKVIFLTDHGDLPVDPVKEAQVAANGGRHDVVTVRLWGLLPTSDLQAGKWSWMQPCTEGGQFTTRIRASAPCSQGGTPTSPLGSALSVSTTYQLSYASLPFGAAGKNDGLTLKKQFQAAFAQPWDWLLVNSWNEHIAQPQTNPWLATMGDLATSMGVVGGAADGSRGWLWVDGYGNEFSRDVEPTVVDQGRTLDLLRSCLRVYRLGGCGAPGAASEACCDVRDTLLLIRSLRIKDPSNALNTHHVLTDDEHERSVLLASGSWEEVCNPIVSIPGICARSDGHLTADGPFQTFAQPGPGRIGLHRCWSGVANFFSTDPLCEGRDYVRFLGYVSQARTSAAPRPLCRCYHEQATIHFHWLGEQCPALPGVRHEAVLGYVR